MWMMEYNDAAGDFDNIQDPFNSRRLRPLVPRPPAVAPPSCLSRIHGADLLVFNHHLAAMAEQNKREMNTQQVVVSSRWNPTPEQLRTLEELYRRGTRTPSGEQIQHITAQLRQFGKIEGKNVFYWFQNHKARERQKRRRQNSDEQAVVENNTLNDEKKDPSSDVNVRANRTVLYEVEQTKNWASPTNSSTINAPEKGVSTQGASKADEAEAELIKAGTDGWIQFETEVETQQSQRRNATWQMMNLSCSSTSTNLITTSCPPSTILNATIPSTVDHMMINPQHHSGFNIFKDENATVDQEQILELFPLQSDRRRLLEDDYGYNYKGDEEKSRVGEDTNNDGTPYQFFEFLPLKN